MIFKPGSAKIPKTVRAQLPAFVGQYSKDTSMVLRLHIYALGCGFNQAKYDQLKFERCMHIMLRCQKLEPGLPAERFIFSFDQVGEDTVALRWGKKTKEDLPLEIPYPRLQRQ